MNNDDLRSHLQTICDHHGHLTAAMVVEAARPKNSPLHAAVFDRGVREAAEQYYLERARQLIRKVRLIYVRPDDTEAKVPAFLSHQTAGVPHRMYEPIERVAEDPMLRAMVLRDAQRDWRTLRARYEHLQEFFEMIRDDLADAA